ncbi:hypothetical protein G6F29_007327 [Rhizopus arrhizus]|uniref:Uncharacterized protein n=1 Tax=Rhizopus oryzae TaxID=64495 RepID=A0A9P6XAG8_RHIOR|nr:hypothetical protein G6F20_010255 [Rhizopus arrhizus]KAG0831205.1 hypothetical protein G6F19_006859 [Rhizopus arrhizus]KAG0833118.1 hypothetical protein G6F18_006911 [Rhizopus arrhizus]KAG0848892.1 hypothetical protein G6F17_011250 [Rhizopus arrhizus]KAG0865381.1 hypothetical protein G6F16_010279 [Rhizopus arrhizus]
MSLFIGRLPSDFEKRELEELFDKFGKIIDCKVKRGSKFAFGFVDFEDSEDAKKAMEDIDGMKIDGVRIAVEIAKGARKESDSNCFKCGERGHWARYCTSTRQRRDRSDSRDRRSGRSDSRDRRRGRSDSRDRYSRRPSYSRSVSRSRSPPRRRRDSRSRSPKRSRSYSREDRSRSVGRSRSPSTRERSPSTRERSPSRSQSPENSRSSS